MCALGDLLRIALNVELRLPGRVVLMKFSALLTAFWQSESEPRTQVSITLVKPASLPPMVMLASVVLLVMAVIWLDLTSEVFAPAHATNLNDAGACEDAHSGA